MPIKGPDFGCNLAEFQGNTGLPHSTNGFAFRPNL